ncbi:MAG TPA: PHP domain-containing protein, partial [Bacteroidales bacterium]|nr:PHP domain-containing protein [Bacteroidales bacterium]
MQIYRADLHIHTLLSPCGSLDMDPDTIVQKAQQKGLDIIGITDHNHTGHCRLVSEIASEKGIFVL